MSVFRAHNAAAAVDLTFAQKGEKCDYYARHRKTAMDMT